MNSMQRKITGRPVHAVRRRPLVASAREGAPSGRRRGIFSGHGVAPTQEESAMEPVLNPMLFEKSETPSPTPVDTGWPGETRRPGKSRAAEYIAALYIALLVCPPWLVLDASFFRPPTTGIEMHLSNAAPVSVDVLARAPVTR